ncbi:hypothetical protein [Lacrimispora celerecrescens]|mgnify:CR=1 FL=1|uniref:Uncharacterized protein n=1 Tax=[Clostridium] celerecrescens 18A TaxID=1286362 RepID=A0A2M8ZAJ4_9FIRM|nr:hypothetical protein [Lacrimispora celerecrescens]PJJ30471.1 hypothetical protein H171_4077 [[Clostridium] celerecrescens 18A]
MDNRLLEKEKKAYVSLYKKDVLPYSLILCAILAELTYDIMVLDVMPVSYLMGVTVMINIVILFVLFTCAVKVNIYHKNWAAIAVFLGIYMLVRMSVLVPLVLKPYARHMEIMAANLLGGLMLLTAGFISLKHTNRRQRLQEQLKQTDAS